MFRFVLIFLCVVFPGRSLCAKPEDGAAVREAVDRIAARLVRIDTIGGHEKVGSEFANEGTSTGFLLDRDGFVLTGAFQFLHDPTSILLRFADGSKKIARKVATDRNRMLTLLRVEGLNEDFVRRNGLETPPPTRSKRSLKPGERCIVVGVALAPDEPNVALGVLGGTNRIWGKAVQTDAAVGPNNYGGPLIDMKGRWIGIAVPLSMTSTELAAGAEMYDAGVGMAIPAEDLEFVLPKLKLGKDLEPGMLGFGFKENKTFIGEAIPDAVQPGSPADLAGMKAGDRIVAVDGRPVRSALELAMDLRPRYAGETLRLTFLRDGKERTVSLTTVPMSEKTD